MPPHGSITASQDRFLAWPPCWPCARPNPSVYPASFLHPVCKSSLRGPRAALPSQGPPSTAPRYRSERHRFGLRWPRNPNSPVDRKSTRLNSSHVAISYAVFCLKKKIHKNYIGQEIKERREH